MDLCKGFGDWLACVKCPYLCTKNCPFEGEDVMEEMKKQMKLFSVLEEEKDRKSFSK